MGSDGGEEQAGGMWEEVGEGRRRRVLYMAQLEGRVSSRCLVGLCYLRSTGGRFTWHRRCRETLPDLSMPDASRSGFPTPFAANVLLAVLRHLLIASHDACNTFHDVQATRPLLSPLAILVIDHAELSHNHDLLMSSYQKLFSPVQATPPEIPSARRRPQFPHRDNHRDRPTPFSSFLFLSLSSAIARCWPSVPPTSGAHRQVP